MGHYVDNNITNRYIDAFPLAQQMEFSSRLLKLNDDADIMEELKGLTPEQLKTLIAMVRNPKISGKSGILIEKILGESGIWVNKISGESGNVFVSC